MTWQVRHLPASTYQQVAWRNGGGVTAEIARGVAPAGVGPDFAWRLSVATVAASGPFSLFAGCDRCIVQLSGPRLRLRHVPPPPGQPTAGTILDLHVPYYFSGDAATSATILDAGTAAIRDFNCIVNNNLFTSSIERYAVHAAPLRFAVTGVAAVYVLAGCVQALAAGVVHAVQTGDTLLIQNANPLERGSVHADHADHTDYADQEMVLELTTEPGAGAASVLLVKLTAKEPSHG